MRVVHISDCFSPRVGGIESQVQDLGVAQARAGHAVHVLTATPLARGEVDPHRSRHRASTTEPGGLRVHRLASPLAFGVPVHPRGRWLIHRALRLLAPDVVHVHAGLVSPFAWDGARAARALGLPLAITWHCVLQGAQTAMRLGARAGGWRQVPFAASGVSSLVAGQVARILEREDVSVLPNGLELAPWRRAAERRVEADAGVLRVVASQRLATRKRAVPLIRIVAGVRDRLAADGEAHARIHLTVAGEGSAARAVRAEIAAADLEESVTLLGRVPREVLPTLYRHQDVFLSPARLEAFGLAALEARAAGLAVVGMAGSGLAEFVSDGVSGHLAADDEGMVDVLTHLATHRPALDRLVQHNVGNAPPLDFRDVLDRSFALYGRARQLQPSLT